MNKATTRPLPCRLRGVFNGLLAAMVSLFVMGIARAQTYPQDTWRYDGVEFGSPATNNSLRCIATGSGGVYVGEVVSGSSSPTKVLHFTEAGVFVSRFSATFTHILGIQCDSAGNVYVLDRGDARVKVYDSTGTFLRQWGGVGTADGLFTYGTNNGVNMLGIGTGDEVFVCDPGNTRVQVFSAAGSFLRKWGELGALPGQFNTNEPTAIAVAPNGLVHLTRKLFRADGSFVKIAERHPGGNYGVSPLVPHACSADGQFVTTVFFGNQYYNFYVEGSQENDVRSLDFPNSNGFNFALAFTKSGAFFANYLTKIRRYTREYKSAVNFLNPLPLPQPMILGAAQRAGTSLVDVSYKVTDTDSPTVRTGLLAYRDGAQDIRNCVVMKTFVEGTSANVGSNQPVDTVRNVVWNMAADWAIDYANIRVEALAKDSRNILGIHWITVPASGGEPALQVSYKPVVDADFEDLWYWFLATGQEVALGNRSLNDTTKVVRAISGPFNGQLLADNNDVTTSLGRLFAAKKMGARPITEAELVRARAGLYGFQSLTAATLVKDESSPTSFVKGWGSNSVGEADWQSFTGNNPVKISAGQNHTLLLKGDGTLWAYGSNDYGQLGTGNTTSRRTPIQVASGVAQIAAGRLHSLFIKTDGSLWGMGYNGQGQLGIGTTANSSAPVPITTSVTSISAGEGHSLFVKTNGTVWSMGLNNYGQLGNGNNNQANSPVQIPTVTGVSQVSAGSNHSFYIKSDGTLWAMGRNDGGQLGLGNTTTRNTPAQVTSVTSVASVAAGQEHSLILKTNGELLVTGRNNYGQFGNGTTSGNATSTPVSVTTGMTGISAGDYHSVFTKADGSLWGMGNNAQGQLNDGTTTNRNTPVQIDANIATFDAGYNYSVGVQLTTP